MASYAESHRRSIQDREGFWAEQAKLIHWHQPCSEVLDYSRPPFARWFVGGETNLCYNALDRHIAARGDQKALVWISTEVGESRTFTFKQLLAEVNRCSAIDLGEQLLVGESPAFADFGRNPHQGLLVAARRDVAVERGVAGVGFAADEPARKRRPRVIEHLAARLVPMDQLRLLGPETLAVLDRTAVEFGVARHPFPPCAPSVKPYPGFFPLNSSTIRSRRCATSPARSPRGCGSVCSSTSSARSMSPGKVAGPLGLASSYPTIGSAWRLAAAWSRCIAARISSSIEPTASMLSEAAPKLLVIRTGWPRQVTCAPSSCARRRRAKASICGGPVPIETIMKVASAVRLTESSARRFAVTMFAIRASSCSAVSLPT